MENESQIALSIIIVMVGDTIERRCDATQLAATLNSLATQIDAPVTEIIVPYHRHVAGIDDLKTRFPHIVFLRVDDLPSLDVAEPSREHHDELRARACCVASGEIVAFLEDHVCPEPRWAQELMTAHRAGDAAAAVGGAVENVSPKTLNWAAYFCDLGKYQNPLPDGPSRFASLVNASYQRAALEKVRLAWQDRFNETTVNRALLTGGHKLTLSSRVVVSQRRESLTFATALKEFYVWGRSFALTRSRTCNAASRLLYAAFSPLLPPLFIWRMTRNVVTKERLRAEFLRALPLIFIFCLSWSAGEFNGYLSSPPRARKAGGQAATVLGQGEI